MTLMGSTANVYAPGEAGTQGFPPSQGQNVNKLGRYNLQDLTAPNVVVAGVAIVAVLWVIHRWLK